MPAGTPSDWLRRYATQGPCRMRLLCLPHAGGSTDFFRSWGHAFGDDVEVLVARYPGREERIRAPFVTTLEATADTLADELAPYLDTPDDIRTRWAPVR